MNKLISIDGSSEPVKVPVRRRNTRGNSTIAISMTIPIELNKVLEEITAKEHKSKSSVATDLMLEALVQREAQKG